MARAPTSPASRRSTRRAEAGLEAAYLPVVSGKVTRCGRQRLRPAVDRLPKPVLAYCRTGTRSTTLWSLAEAARGRALPEIVATAKAGGYDMTRRRPPDRQWRPHPDRYRRGAARGRGDRRRRRRHRRCRQPEGAQPRLDIAIIDPADIHYYQPGWTMVGGASSPPLTRRGPWPRSFRAASHGSRPRRPPLSRRTCRHSRRLPGRHL